MYNFDDMLPVNPPQKCEAPHCFIASYPPVARPGQANGFFVNTYFLQPDRKSELAGPVPVRSNGKCS